MFGIFNGMYLFLLQREQLRYFKEDNPVEAMIFIIAVGAVIVLALLFHFIRHSMSSSIAGKGKTVSPRKFNAFTLYRIASAYGLDKEQTKLLEFVFRNDSVNDPERVMKNPALLDRHFKRTYRIIEKNSETDDDVQQRLVKLFSLRNVIEAAPGAGAEAPSSNRLAENTPAVLAIDQDSYPVKVISSRGQNVITEIPKNTLGSHIRIARGTRLTLSFFTKASKGFSVNAQTVGIGNTDHGQGLQIVHTGRFTPLAKRKYRRKEASVRCEFFFVNLVETGTGRKQTSKMVVDSRKFSGTVLDLSIGGCSLKTSAPIQVGSRLKISILYDDNYPLSVLAQVLRSNRSSAGNIIHAKFLKVPRKVFNSISALVYGYAEN